MRQVQSQGRAAGRVLAWGAASALLVAQAGSAGERLWFGRDIPTARARIAADIQQRFNAMSRDLDAAVARVRADAVLATAVQTRDVPAVRELFDRLAEVEASLELPGVAVTVYGLEVLRPLAWAGRPREIVADFPATELRPGEPIEIGQLNAIEALARDIVHELRSNW